MARFLLDQYLNAISPSNFAATNPEVVKRTKETGGANLVQGFLNLLEDVGSGKGIVQRRTDPNAFEKGKTIAATPGAVVFENALFQLIQYNPATEKVAAEPLLYVPPLVNRYYMIDLVPRQSLVKWLVEEGRTVFVISWVNPGPELKDKDVGDYVLAGIVEAIGAVRKRAGSAPDLFSFCLGGTLAAIALAWLAAKGRADEVNSATLIGALVDFSDMRDWSAFVARSAPRRARGPSRSAGLCRQHRTPAAVRGDARQRPHLVVGREPLSARPPAPAVGPALLVRGRRAHPCGLPQELQPRTAAREQAQGAGGLQGRRRRHRPRSDHHADPRHRAQGRPRFGLGSGLWRRAPPRRRLHPRRIGTQCGHRQSARRQQARLLDQRTSSRQMPTAWLDAAKRHEGSWWPWWTQWLDEHGSGKTRRGAPAQGRRSSPRPAATR